VRSRLRRSVSFVWNFQQQNSSRQQHVVPVAQRSQRERQMLENVAAITKSDWPEQRQLHGVGHDIRVDDCLANLRIVLLEVLICKRST